MPAVDRSVVEFHDAHDGRHLSEIPGCHWASCGLWNPLKFWLRTLLVFAHEEKTTFWTLFTAAMRKLKTNRASRRNVVAVNTWYPCGYTWRSAKGHTSRVDYMLYDASRVEEVKKNPLWHAELQTTTVVLSVQLRSKVGTDIDNNRRKKKKNASTHHSFKIRFCVLSSKKDCGRLHRSLETAFLTTLSNSRAFY